MHRVRRDELYGSSSEEEGHSQADAEEDAEVRAKLNERLSSLLGLDLSVPAPASEEVLPQDVGGAADQEVKPEDEEEEFEFRLFSTSSKTAAPVKVILTASDDEGADLGDGAFTVPERPSSYYFAGEPTPEQIQMYRQSALAGEDILLGARKRAWGLERPWRMIRIGGGSAKSVRTASLSVKGSSAVMKITAATTNEDEKLKRKRPGKKRRIATRIKTKAEKEKREAAEMQKMTKEEHLKEKKKRLNREKKLKRRAKEREQKLAGKGQDGSQPTVSNPADSGSDDDDSAA